MQEEKGRRAGVMSLSQGQKGSRAHVAAPAFTSAQTHVQSRAGGPWAVSGPWAVRQILPPPVCAWCPPLQRPRLSPSLLPEPTSLTFGCHLASSPGPELVTTSKWRTLLTATAGPLRMESQCRRCLASCPLPEREGKALQEKDVLGSTCHCGTVRPGTGPPPQPARLLHHSRLIWEIMSPGSGNRVQTG